MRRRSDLETERKFFERLGAKLDEKILNFVSQLERTHAEAVVVIRTRADSRNDAATSDLFERVLHAGFEKAVQMLPWMPLDRREFDAFPILLVGQLPIDFVGWGRFQLRSWWILYRGNANGTCGFFRPNMTDDKISPLH
jgi:hypothetical protein